MIASRVTLSWIFSFDVTKSGFGVEFAPWTGVVLFLGF